MPYKVTNIGLSKKKAFIHVTKKSKGMRISGMALFRASGFSRFPCWFLLRLHVVERHRKATFQIPIQPKRETESVPFLRNPPQLFR